MDLGRVGHLATIRALTLAAALLASAGCARDRPIRPFGSVQTYNSTVAPGPSGHPRGEMPRPQALGIDLVRRSSGVGPPPMPGAPTSFDPQTRPAGAPMTSF